MKLLEYQAKTILRHYRLPLPSGQLLDGQQPPTLDWPYLLKVQVPVGGRGKAGGVQVVRNPAEHRLVSATLSQLEVAGHHSQGLYAEELLDIAAEFYLALTIDRAAGLIELLVHNQGGIDIEQATTPPRRYQLEAAPAASLTKQLATYLNLKGSQLDQLQRLLDRLYHAFTAGDLLLLEINPLILTTDQRLVCADAKLETDDAARFRHADLWPASPNGSANYVVLDRSGRIGSIANGAGLAMATVDAITAAGYTPANFLDVGGGSDSAKLVTALQAIADLPAVEAIIVNIFGGITRCDDVARAIITARQQLAQLPPLHIRLSGTNASAGRQLLAAAGLKSYDSLEACLAALPSGGGRA